MIARWSQVAVLRRESGRLSWLRGHRGVTLIELLVASFIALIFTMAAGTAYLVNQDAYRRNEGKLELQRMVTQSMEIMERRIRSAARAAVPNVTPPRIELYDRSGASITRFRMQALGATNKLFEGSQLMAEQALINLRFTPNADTSVVTIFLEMRDTSMNRVALQSSATLRNHPKFANIGS